MGLGGVRSGTHVGIDVRDVEPDDLYAPRAEFQAHGVGGAPQGCLGHPVGASQGIQETIEATLITTPERCARRSAKAEVTASGPNRLVSNSRRRLEVSGSRTEPTRAMSALFTTTLTSCAISAARSTESASVTSSRSGTSRGSMTVIALGRARRRRRSRPRDRGVDGRTRGRTARPQAGHPGTAGRAPAEVMAGTDAEAVARARDSRADLVVMDIRMPDMNGIEATRRITADEALAGVKILILTTYETDALVAAALRAGASGYLGKGTKPDFLLHSIRTRPAAARSSADEPARA